MTITWIAPYLYASPLPRLHHLYIMSSVIIVELLMVAKELILVLIWRANWPHQHPSSEVLKHALHISLHFCLPCRTRSQVLHLVI